MNKGVGRRGRCSIDNGIFREVRLLVSSSQLPVTSLSWKMIATERMDYSSHRNDSTHTDFFEILLNSDIQTYLLEIREYQEQTEGGLDH